MMALLIAVLYASAAVAVADQPTQVYLVTPDRAVASVALAADELESYLPRVANVTVVRLPAAAFDEAHRPAIVVGLAPPGAEPVAARDGYRFASTAGTLWLFGRDDDGDPLQDGGSKGSLYAAYDYLTSAYGVRWVFPGDDGVSLPTAKRPLVIDGLDRSRAPAFEQRILNGGGDDARLWKLRNRLGTGRIVESGHAFGDWWEKYHEAHPEWFAQHRNGQRVLHGKPGRVKLCDSNPEVVRTAVARGLERANAHSVSISGSPNDSALSNFCMCDGCRALDPSDGPKLTLNDVDGSFEYVYLSDRYAAFWNAMAAELGKTRPDLHVAAYAYYCTSLAPQKTELHPKVMIGFVQHAGAYWDRTIWERERELFLGWAKKAKTSFWRPNSLLISAGMPTNYLPRLAEDLRLIQEHGARHVYYDSLVPHWGTMGPTYYVLAQLLWDPSQGVEEVMEDYLAAGYGPAAPAVGEYMAELLAVTDRVFESKLVSEGWRYSAESAAAVLYDEPTLGRLTAALDAAARAAAESPAHLKRVRVLQDGLAFTRLQLAVHRLAYLGPLPLDYESGPLGEAAAARDAWLREHDGSLAVSVPSVQRLIETLRPGLPKVRERLPSSQFIGE